MVDDMVGDKEVHMVADMEVDKVADTVADMMADKKKLFLTDMLLHTVVDKVVGMVAGHGCWLIGPKLFRPKPYLTCVSSRPCEFIQRIFCSGVRWHH